MKYVAVVFAVLLGFGVANACDTKVVQGVTYCYPKNDADDVVVQRLVRANPNVVVVKDNRQIRGADYVKQREVVVVERPVVVQREVVVQQAVKQRVVQRVVQEDYQDSQDIVIQQNSRGRSKLKFDDGKTKIEIKQRR